MEFFTGIKKVRARFNFKGSCDEELTFNKGDIITVTQIIDGGWWEGIINDNLGWFPCNYVRDLKGPGSPVKSASNKENTTTEEKNEYQDQVVQNMVETEKEYCKELGSLLITYLKPLMTARVLPADDHATLCGNFEELLAYQQSFLTNLEDISKMEGKRKRVGACFIKAAAQFKDVYSNYSANHPRAATVLTKQNEEISRFMESKGSTLLALTMGLSSPFRRMERYPNDLKELERHTAADHPDRIDVTTAMSVYKDVYNHCQRLRRQKEIQLDIMTGTVHEWEGEPISTLGEVLKMIQAHEIFSGGGKKDFVFLLFATHLVMLSPTPSMNGYLFQHKLPIATVLATTLPDTEKQLGAFEVSGSGMEMKTIVCSSLMDREDIVDAIHNCQKGFTSSKKKKKPPPIPIQHSNKRDPSPSVSSPNDSTTPRLVPSDINRSATKPSTQNRVPSPTVVSSVVIQRTISGLRPAPPINPITVWSQRKNREPVKGKKKKDKEKAKQFPETPFLRIDRQEEDSKILRVIEAYCFSNGNRNTITSIAVPPDPAPCVFLAEDEKIIVEKQEGNEIVVEEKSLIDTVYALRDQVKDLVGETKTLKKDLEEERKARRKLELSVRKSMKSIDFKYGIPNL